MQNKKMALLSAVVAIGIVLILFLSFYLSSLAYRSENKITLPKDGAGDIQTGGNDNRYSLEDLTLNPDNVVSVIQSLQRPSAYSNSAEVTVYWGENSAVKKYDSYVTDAFLRVDSYKPSGTVDFTTLLSPLKAYTWRSGSSDYATFSRGNFSGDDYQNIPTYETLLALDPGEINEASFVDYHNEVCIFIRAEIDGYRGEYLISTVHGLLVSFELYKGDSLVRRAQISNMKLETPEESLFLLPNGAVAT